MDIQTLLTVGLIAMLTGGMVKGTFGIGLPLVAVPQLSLVFSLPLSTGLLVMPTIVTNLWQSFDGGRAAVVARLRKFGFMSVTLIVTLVIGAQILVAVPEKFLYGLIGVSIVTFSTITHFRPSFRISEQQHRWIGPIAGAFAGLLGGMTSFYGPPLMIYLVGLRLNKDEFVGVISLLYFVSAFGFGLGLGVAGVADMQLLTYSALACIPTFIGIWLGQRVRTRLNERSYANWLYVFYLLIGGSFLVRLI